MSPIVQLAWPKWPEIGEVRGNGVRTLSESSSAVGHPSSKANASERRERVRACCIVIEPLGKAQCGQRVALETKRVPS